MLSNVTDALAGNDSLLTEAGAKRGRNKRAAAAAAKKESALSPALALRVLWSWLDKASTREALLTRQPADKLTALRDALAATVGRASGTTNSDGAREPLHALACFLQLSWHLAAAAAVGRGGRADPRAEESALAEARASVRTMIATVHEAHGDDDGPSDIVPIPMSLLGEKEPPSPASILSPGEVRRLYSNI